VREEVQEGIREGGREEGRDEEGDTESEESRRRRSLKGVWYASSRRMMPRLKV